jgi:hypothetical protein
MPVAALWGLVGSLVGATVTIFGVYIAQHAGLRQIAIGEQHSDLNLRTSMPVLDTTVRLTERPVDASSAYHPFHFVIVSIHNYGELAAQQLRGQWRIYSPDNIIQEQTIPIFRDALGSTAYEFEPRQVTGQGVDRAMAGGGRITFNIDIEFDYLGLPHDKPEHYSARYRYDAQSQLMLRIQKT